MWWGKKEKKTQGAEKTMTYKLDVEILFLASNPTKFTLTYGTKTEAEQAKIKLVADLIKGMKEDQIYSYSNSAFRCRNIQFFRVDVNEA